MTAQLRWELRRLWRRPRSYVGFAASLLFQLLCYGLLQLPAVRVQFVRGVWRLHERLEIDRAFSALSAAIEVTGQTMLLIGAVALALVASDVMAREAEDGTLRTILCRPATRTSILLQKLVVCVVYTIALTAFVGTSALLLGLVLEGPARFAVVSARESILGVHEFGPGLVRYAGALALLATSLVTVTLLALAISCFPIKAGTATTVTILVLLADWTIQAHPVFAPVSPYTLMTRLSSWRQVFNDTVPWLRLQLNYTDLLLLDVGLLAVAWGAFRRRPLGAP